MAVLSVSYCLGYSAPPPPPAPPHDFEGIRRIGRRHEAEEVKGDCLSSVVDYPTLLRLHLISVWAPLSSVCHLSTALVRLFGQVNAYQEG